MARPCAALESPRTPGASYRISVPASLAANHRARQPGLVRRVLSESCPRDVGIRLEDGPFGCFSTLPRYSGPMSAQPSRFDSHRFVKRLTNAGLSQEAAEILAEEHASRFSSTVVATKADVAEVGAATRSDIAETKAEVAKTKAEFALAVAEVKELIVATQRSTLKWMFGMMLAYSGIILAAMANFR